MSQLKVDAIRHTGASSDAITLSSDGKAKVINSSTPPGNRNLVINGAMQVHQRGTSYTDQGYGVMDRFALYWNGANNVLEQHEHALTSSDTGPWAKGFRKSLFIRNGDQTASSPEDDYAVIWHRIEAQDIAKSGWDYTSASSYLTLSFWVKASVAMNYQGYFVAEDSPQYTCPFETGSLTAGTWKYVTVTIPGNSNLVMVNDNGPGLRIVWAPFRGSDQTDNSLSLNTWAAYNHPDDFCRDSATTWWTTDNAEFELTGVQLEVGDTATDFEHRTYGDDLARCQRYLQYSDESTWHACIGNGSSNCHGAGFTFQVPMRAQPSVSATSVYYSDHDSYTGAHTSQPTVSDFDVNGIALHFPSLSGCDDNRQGQISIVHTNRIKFEAEL